MAKVQRSEMRVKIARQLLPKVKSFVQRHGYDEIDLRARAQDLPWYRNPANAWQSYKNWVEGKTVPEFWIMHTYNEVVGGGITVPYQRYPKKEVKPEETKIQNNGEVTEQSILFKLEVALEMSGLRKSEQFKILSLVAEALEEK